MKTYPDISYDARHTLIGVQTRPYNYANPLVTIESHAHTDGWVRIELDVPKARKLARQILSLTKGL